MDRTQYPSRVTLCEDGVYRWSYDMDMRRNRYLINLLAKALAIIFAVPVGFMLVLVLQSSAPLLSHARDAGEAMLMMRDRMGPVLLALAVWAGVMALTYIIYGICVVVMHGNYHLCFEMDETCVALVQSPKALKTVDTVRTAAVITALAAGKTRSAFHTNVMLSGAEALGKTDFRSVRRMWEHPENDVIDLGVLFGRNQIYVNRQDYHFVRTFIRQRVRDKAKT